MLLGALHITPVQALQSVTLAWSPSADPNVAGYHVYCGVASRTYTYGTNVGNALSTTISGLIEGTTYFFAVTAYDALKLESTPSDEVSYTVPGTPPLSTVFLEAESGVVTTPMIQAANASASGGQYVYSPTDEVGTVSFSLNLTQAADYVVWCRVFSADGSSDSLYVSVDNANEDVYDAMLSNSNLYTGNWTWTPVNGRANGNPRLISLSAGVHVLSFRCRESSTLLDALYLTSDRNFVPPVIPVNQAPSVRICVTPAQQVILTVTGQIGHTNDILATQDFTAWTVIGTVTPGVNGSVEFTDSDAASRPARFYRTREKP